MNFEKFDKICKISLLSIQLLQIFVLIFNIDAFIGIINFRLSDFLFIIFWIILAFNIGAIIDNRFLKEK